MSGDSEVRPRLLGLGWSPDRPGGLNRYFRDLVTALGEPRAVVIGPAQDPLPGVTVVSDHDAPLVARLRAFAGAVSTTDVDVVDAHFALYAAWPVLMGAARRLPLVVHFHGPWAREATAERGVRSASAAARQWLERAVYRRARRVVTLSGSFARLVVHDYGVDPWRVVIIPPGVDLDRFRAGDRARASLGIAPGTPVVLAVRRLVPRTGIDTLLSAWAQVEPDAVLLVAGDGPERSRLEQRARALDGRDVQFLGAVDDDDLPALYRAADVSVVPSTALEGFGLVVLESLASGTPVLVSDVGGLPEALAGLPADLVVPAGDARALADRLTTALDGTMPLPSAAACRAHAERFSWTAAAERHRAVYADAVEPPTRRRVLFVDHCARLSGAEIALLRTVPALTELDAHVMTFEDGPLLAALGAAGITAEICELPARTRDVHQEQVGRGLPWRSLTDSTVQVVKLARRFRRLRPDVVHTNSLKASLLAGMAARLARVPCVWHVRDHVDGRELSQPAVTLVRRLARRLPIAVVANSGSTLASLRLPDASGPLQAVIPDPVPDEFFAVSRRAPDDGEVVVGIVGRLAPWKGQHVFLDAFARAFPAGGTRAHVVGDALFGEDDYRAALHEQADRLGVGDRVTFRGFRADVAAELAALDVLAHASVQAEPFGQVVVEGMAAGVAVIATAAGGPAEIITGGHDGVLVPPGDVDALARAMRELVDHPTRRAELGRHARATAQQYRRDVVAPRFVALYDAIDAARC